MPSSGGLRKLLRETHDSKWQTIRGKHAYLRTKPKQYLPQDGRGHGGIHPILSGMSTRQDRERKEAGLMNRCLF